MAENAAESFNILSSSNDTVKVTQGEENSAAQIQDSSMVSSEFRHDDGNEIQNEEVENVIVAEVINEEVCTGQVVERNRSDDASSSNLCQDEAATSCMQRVVDWQNSESHAQLNSTTHYPMPRLNFW